MSGHQLTSCKFSTPLSVVCLGFVLFMNIFAWNSCGLGMAHKRNSIRNRLINNNVGICFLLETKKNNCVTPSFEICGILQLSNGLF